MNNSNSFSKIPYTWIVWLSVLLIAVALAVQTYYINYWPTDSRYLYIPTAQLYDGGPFISVIHEKNAYVAIYNKEVLIIGIIIFQRLLNDFESLFPNILLLIVYFAGTAVLIYHTVRKWLDPPSGFFAFVLFVTCFWTYQYVLQGAHQPVVLFHFMLAIFFIFTLRINFTNGLLTGLALGLMFYSSPSSPTYGPYILGAYVYQLLYKFPPKIHTQKMILNALGILLGFTLIYLFITLPHPIENTKNYIQFLEKSRSSNDFTNPQTDFGVPFPELSKRGAGWSWIFQYIYLIQPVLCLSYLFCALFLITTEGKKIDTWLLLFISFSTPLCVEFIQVAQFGRNYFSWLPGMLLLIVYTFYIIKNMYFEELAKQTKTILFIALISVTSLHGVYNGYLFFQDVFPSRMATNSIYNWLNQHPGKNISTYINHPYTNNFELQLNNPKHKKKIEFTKITSSIAEAKQGYIFIPPITGKGIYANCQINDFYFDPALNKVLTSGRFEDYVVKKFKTMASSKIWPQEEEYCSYLDLHLRSITPLDRYLGHAFILDAEKIHKDFMFEDIIKN